MRSMIFIIIGLIFIIKWLVQSTKGGQSGPLGNSTGALDILKERYARGEMDREEFEQKKRDLTE